MNEPTLPQLTDFADTHRECGQLLDDIIERHITDLTDTRWEVCVAGLAWYLTERSDPTSLGHLLAVAVNRLACQQQGWTRPTLREAA